MNEADTCRIFVVPKLQAAGWDNDPHSIAEQRIITEARQILDELLEKYAGHGAAQFVLPDVLNVPPVSDHGQIGDLDRLPMRCSAAVLGCGFERRPAACSHFRVNNSNWQRDAAFNRRRGRLRHGHG